MKTILVPLDGSAIAEQILPAVRMLAPIMGAKVNLLHVVPEMDRFQLETQDDFREPFATEREQRMSSWDTLRHNAERYLEPQAAALRAAGIGTTFEVRLGAPAEIIVDVSERGPVDLVAIATHGYSGIKRWALGSVTDKLVHAVHMPVLVVRGSAEPPVTEHALKRILVPLDGSALARQALPFAAELARATQAELILLTIAAPPLIGAPELISTTPHYDDMLATLQQRLPDELGGLAAEFSAQGVTVSSLAQSGFPADLIVDTADERQADLIVMATHGYSGIKRWALGSVADKVLHATKTPLVLVRARNNA